MTEPKIGIEAAADALDRCARTYPEEVARIRTGWESTARIADCRQKQIDALELRIDKMGQDNGLLECDKVVLQKGRESAERSAASNHNAYINEIATNSKLRREKAEIERDKAALQKRYEEAQSKATSTHKAYIDEIGTNSDLKSAYEALKQQIDELSQQPAVAPLTEERIREIVAEGIRSALASFAPLLAGMQPAAVATKDTSVAYTAGGGYQGPIRVGMWFKSTRGANCVVCDVQAASVLMNGGRTIPVDEFRRLWHPL